MGFPMVHIIWEIQWYIKCGRSSGTNNIGKTNDHKDKAHLKPVNQALTHHGAQLKIKPTSSKDAKKR